MHCCNEVARLEFELTWSVVLSNILQKHYKTLLQQEKKFQKRGLRPRQRQVT